jgi:hypothetical protein
MPIQYEIDRECGIVRHEFTGAITVGELESYWRDFLSENELPRPLALFADMRQCKMDVHGEDIQAIVHTVIEPLLGERRWVAAAVVGSPSEYGVTKQFMVYSERCGVTEVFLDPNEALAWLQSARGCLFGA